MTDDELRQAEAAAAEIGARHQTVPQASLSDPEILAHHVFALVAEVRRLNARVAALEASRENLLRQMAAMQREVWELRDRVAALQGGET